MKKTSLVMREVVWPNSIKYQNIFYSHGDLKSYEGTKVFVNKESDCLHVYDNRKKLICIARKKMVKKTKTEKLSDIGLFELAARSCMSPDVFAEIRSRTLRILVFLDNGDIAKAKNVVQGLLASPQERRRA